MWSFLSWLWSVVSHFAFHIFAMAGLVRIVWMAFNEGRKYQMRKIRGLLSRVRESKKELNPSAPAAIKADEQRAA